MPVCRQCHASFSNSVTINGKVRNLQRRKFCTVCSPFGGHNTSATNAQVKRCKHCGTTDPAAFYTKRQASCRACHNRNVIALMKRRLTFCRSLLGNKCAICGYDQHPAALSIHHLDPLKKDPNFRHHRSWSEARLQRELKHCVLLCLNCHAALHARQLLLPDAFGNR